MKLIYEVGHYGPTPFEADTDSPAEALFLLAEFFVEREGSRLPTPSVAYPLTVKFEKGDRDAGQ